MIDRFFDTVKITIAQLRAGFELWTRNNNFCVLYGPSGDGKTDIAVNVLAEELGIEDSRPHSEGGDVYCLNYTDKGPQEAAGYGFLDDDKIHMNFSANRDLPTLHKVKNSGSGDPNRPILLIFDEFSVFDPTVQSMIRPLQSRRGNPIFGTHELAPNIRILITGNRVEDGSPTASDPDQAILKRGKFFIIENTFEEWLKWAENKDWFVDNDIISYLMYVRDLADTTRTEDGETRRKIDEVFKPSLPLAGSVNPSACPRQWENVCSEFKVIQNESNLDEAGKLELLRFSLAGAIGIKATEDIMSFIESIKEALPKFKAVLKGDSEITDFEGLELLTILSIANRQAIKQAKKIATDDGRERVETKAHRKSIRNHTGAAVKAGEFDWYLDQFINPTENQEIARFSAENVDRFAKLKGNTKKWNF